MGCRTLLKACCSCTQQRYIMGCMSFLGVAVSYMMRNCLSMAITEMVKHPKKKDTAESEDACPDHPDISEDAETHHGDFEWAEDIQGHVISAFYGGYIFTQFPGGMLADCIGGKHVLGTGIFITAIFTLLCPLAAKIHFGALCASRFIAGLGSGVVFPAVNVLLARWIPPNERSRMGALVFASTQIGNVISISLSGVILKFVGWPSVFFFFGTLGVIWYIFWLFVVTSEPEIHPFITDEEKAFLEQSLSGVTTRKDIPPLPFCRIMRSLPVWALVICQYGHDWCLYTMQNDLPKYMRSVLKFSAAKHRLVQELVVYWLYMLVVIVGWL